jgi:hypothetical protein
MNGRCFWLFLGGLAYLPAPKHKRRHRWRIRNIIKKRGTFGTYNHIVNTWDFLTSSMTKRFTHLKLGQRTFYLASSPANAVREREKSLHVAIGFTLAFLAHLAFHANVALTSIWNTDNRKSFVRLCTALRSRSYRWNTGIWRHIYLKPFDQSMKNGELNLAGNDVNYCIVLWCHISNSCSNVRKVLR